MLKKILSLSALSLAVLFLAGCGKKDLENNGGGGNGKGQAGPPTEALNACQGKSQGDSCQFTMTRNAGDSKTMTGTCQKNMQSDELTCFSGEGNGPGNGKEAPTKDTGSSSE